MNHQTFGLIFDKMFVLSLLLFSLIEYKYAADNVLISKIDNLKMNTWQYTAFFFRWSIAIF